MRAAEVSSVATSDPSDNRRPEFQSPGEFAALAPPIEEKFAAANFLVEERPLSDQSHRIKLLRRLRPEPAIVALTANLLRRSELWLPLPERSWPRQTFSHGVAVSKRAAKEAGSRQQIQPD